MTCFKSSSKRILVLNPRRADGRPPSGSKCRQALGEHHLGIEDGLTGRRKECFARGQVLDRAWGCALVEAIVLSFCCYVCFPACTYGEMGTVGSLSPVTL